MSRVTGRLLGVALAREGLLPPNCRSFALHISSDHPPTLTVDVLLDEEALRRVLLAMLAALGSASASASPSDSPSVSSSASASASPSGSPSVSVSPSASLSPSASGGSIYVPSGGDLQAALNAAQGGDQILLAATGTWTGNYTLPAHNGPPITVTSNGTLPAPGARMTPGWSGSVPSLGSANPMPCVTTRPGAAGWTLVGVEVRPNGGARAAGTALQFGDHTTTVAAEFPDAIVADRLLIRGDAVTGQKRGVAAHGTGVTIRGCHIGEMKATGEDAQAIWIYGPGPYLIANNYLAASGENFLAGGATPGIAGMRPRDVRILNNELEKPIAWRGQPWAVKNLLEIKDGDGFVIRGNDLHGHWAGAQDGYAVLFTPRNQGGSAPTTVVQAIVFECNRVWDVSSCINLLGDDNEHPSARTNGILIRNNLLIATRTYGGDGRIFKIGRSPRDVRIERNTMAGDGTSMAFFSDNTRWAETTGWVIADNLWRHMAYGIIGDGTGSGTATLTTYLNGPVYAGNVMGGGQAALYPTGNTRLSDSAWLAIFTDFAGRDYTVADPAYAEKGRDWSCA